MRTLFGFMNIVMIPKIKIYVHFLFIIGFLSVLFSSDIDKKLQMALKDNLINLNEIDGKHSNQPEYLFLKALLDTDGDSALEKYKNFVNKFPRHAYSDNAVFQLGSYYYTKGYYLKSSQWYKKIPIYYHDSEFLNESMDMFFKTLELTDSKDSIIYYQDVFSKLYPNLKNDNLSSVYVSNFDKKESVYDTKYTIQIGAFKEYPRAESRFHMLRNLNFGVRIEEMIIDNDKFFVIREGTYSTKKSADKIASRIKARTGIKCIIIEL